MSNEIELGVRQGEVIPELQEQPAGEPTPRPAQIKKSLILLSSLGIMSVVNGTLIGWNFALVGGYGRFLVAAFVLGSAFLGYYMCVAEMSSALPFSGGSYGIARCTVGYYWGFLAGCSEVLSFIAATAFNNYGITNIFVGFFPRANHFQPLILFALYIGQMAVCGMNVNIFWKTCVVLSLFAAVLILAGCFGNVAHVDFEENVRVEGSLWVSPIPITLITAFPSIFGFYSGVDTIVLAVDDAEEPRKNIPRALVIASTVIFTFAMLVMIIGPSTAPGTEGLMDHFFTLTPGLMRVFGGSEEVLVLIQVIPLFGSVCTQQYAYSKLVRSMADSKLLPSVFSKRVGHGKFAIWAAVVGSCIGYFLCILQYLDPPSVYGVNAMAILFNFTYTPIQLIAYIRLKTHHFNLPR